MKNKVKVVVAGGREFNNYSLLKNKLAKILNSIPPQKLEIVSGTARGADALGEKYAKENNLELKLFPANWDRYGNKAGFIRNKEMAIYATHAVIFWDGKSRGTASMIDLAKEYNLNFRVIKYK